MTGNIIADFVLILFAIALVNFYLRKRKIEAWRKNSEVELFAPVKGIDAFAGLTKDGLVSDGVWINGYSGMIPFSHITNIDFDPGTDKLTVPKLSVTFLEGTSSHRTVRFLSPGKVSDSLRGEHRENFIKFGETALARWQQTRK